MVHVDGGEVVSTLAFAGKLMTLGVPWRVLGTIFGPSSNEPVASALRDVVGAELSFRCGV